MLEAGTQCKLCRKPRNPVVVDVLVIMQLQFQQFLVHEREDAYGPVFSSDCALSCCATETGIHSANVQNFAEIQ